MQLATKFGIYFNAEGGGSSVRGDPEYVRSACEGSLKRLDVECIDLYYQHRLDATVPIEVTVSLLGDLIYYSHHINLADYPYLNCKLFMPEVSVYGSHGIYIFFQAILLELRSGSFLGEFLLC